MSGHDAAVANIRRYTRRQMERLLEAAGFRVLFASYWNTLLFPVMVAARKLAPAGARPASDDKLYPPAVEALCRAATSLERALLARGVRLPFGGSLIAVAEKPAAATGQSDVEQWAEGNAHA
jgi:hypothetical protein